MKKLLILFYILLPYYIFSQTKDSLNLRSLVYKNSLIEVQTKYLSGTKLKNKYLNYNIDYGYSTLVKTLIPISVKHKKFKIMGNLTYFKEHFKFNNFEIKDQTAKNLKLIPKHVNISGEKLLTSLRFINILNVFNKKVVLTTNLNSYTNSDWEFKKLTGTLIITLPIKTESKKSMFSLGVANLLRENNQFIAFPIISYNKLLSNNYLLSAIIPYKIKFSKIYNQDFNIGIEAKLATDWPLVDVAKSNFYGSNKDLILSSLGIDIGFDVEKRLNKYFVLGAESGISNIIRSEMQDENRKKLVENDPYNNFYFKIKLGLRIKR